MDINGFQFTNDGQSLIIRNVEPAQKDTIAGWMRQNDWVVTPQDILDIMQAYPTAIYGVFDGNSALISTLNSIKYGVCLIRNVDQNVGYFSWFMTDSQYRRRGIGKQLMGKALENLGAECLIFLDTLPKMVPYYEKFGFQKDSFRLKKIACVYRKSPVLPRSPVECVVDFCDLTKAEAEKLYEFDKIVSGDDRRQFLDVWLSSEASIAKCLFTDKGHTTLSGYGAIRLSQETIGFCPMSMFYVRNLLSAELLLAAILEDAPTDVPFRFSCPNRKEDDVIRIVSKFGECTVQTERTEFRMRRGSGPTNVRWPFVYSVTNTECQIV